MQCPPAPGPGKKGRKPKGLVAAAVITSFESMPRWLQRTANSLINPMFTRRNVFSSNFTVSAARAFETGCTTSTSAA